MSDRIVNYVLSRQDQPSALRLEDLAVCSVYVKKSPEACAEVARIMEQWSAAAGPERPATFGRRQQILLRAVIDLLLKRGPEGLSWHETDFLCEALDLAGRAMASAQRVRELLQPHLDALQARRENTRQSLGVNMLEARVRLIFVDQLMESPRRQVLLFPGQPRPPLGPTLETAGPVRLIGGIPDDCTLIVTAGPCSVDGYVQGRLSVADGCDISENISGAAVALAGSIRCRNVIEKSFVVAKTGSVKFIQAMHPQTIFAGDRIGASESISRGLIFGSNIKAGVVKGGTIHVSGRLSADRFLPDETYPLNIVLRTAISFEEYGEQLGAEALRLRARAAGLRRKLAHLENMVRVTQAEAEHAASTIVLRGFSDSRLMNVLEDRARAGRRVAVLNRLIGAMQELYAGAEEALAQNGEFSDEMAGDAMLSDIEQDLDELAGETPAEVGLVQEHEEIRALYERLGWTRNDRTQLLGVLGQLRDQMEAWISERQALNAQLDRLNHEINRAVPEAELETIAQRAKQDREPKLAALQRRIMGLKDNPPTPEVRRKLQAPLVVLMINMLQRRIQRLNELGARIRTCKRDLAAVTGELQAKYGLGENAGAEAAPAAVSGRFAAGVRIYRDAYLVDEPKPPAGAVIETPDSGEKVVTYQRGLACVVAEPPTSPPRE